MNRRSRLFPAAALVAAVAAGCVPVVSNQQAQQRDVIGGVTAGADVCTAPQALQLLVGGPIGGGPINLRQARAALRGDAGRLVPSLDDLFTCPDRDDLVDLLDDGTVDSAVMGMPHQLLVAYRVPAGATAPASFQATGVAAVADAWQSTIRGGDAPVEQPVDVTFRRAPELDAQVGKFYDVSLTGLDGKPELVRDGEKIVGYLSSQLPGPLFAPLKVAAQFGLPAGTADEPYGGPFNALTLVGSRIALTDDQVVTRGARALRTSARGGVPTDIADALSPDRPVECLDDELTGPPRGGPSLPTDLLTLAVCPTPVPYIISGQPEELVDELTDAVRGVDAATRDLRVLGGEGFAEAGSAATVPFTLRTAGAASGAQLALGAATGLGGATASPHSAAVAFPATGDHAAPVTVQIPEDAAPGTYDVTLTATVAGQTRTGTGRVVVLPKAPATTTVGSRGRDNVYMDRQGNIAFGWICPPACGEDQVDVTGPKAGIAPKANTAAVSKPRLLRIARGRFKASAGKRARVKVKLFPKARRAVRRGRSIKAIIVVRTNGKGVPSVRRVTIKQRKAKR